MLESATRAVIEQLEARQLLSLTNAGFELPDYSSAGQYAQPSADGWYFNSDAGIATNSSDPLGSRLAPEGDQVGYLAPGATLSQSFSTEGINYVVRFKVALDSQSSSSAQLSVRYGSNTNDYINVDAPTDGSFVECATPTLPNIGNPHVLEFYNSDSAATWLIDDVRLEVETVEPTVTEPQMGTVNVAWPAFNGDDSYTLWRSTDNATFANVATATYGTPSWHDYYANPDTTYYYCVMDSSGRKTSAVAFTTAAPFDAPVVEVDQGHLRVSWNRDGNAFNVFRTVDGGSMEQVASDWYCSPYVDTNVSINHTYTYRIFDPQTQATSGDTALALSADPLQAPAVSVASAYALRVRWTAGDSYTTAVHIRRSADGGANWTNLTFDVSDLFTVAGSLSVLDSGVQPGQTYRYQIEPMDGLCVGSMGPITQVATPAARPLVRVGASSNKVVSGTPYVLRLVYPSVEGTYGVWSVTVDWGDGSAPETDDCYSGLADTFQHTYSTQGYYDISVTPVESGGRTTAVCKVGYDTTYGTRGDGTVITDALSHSNQPTAAARDDQGRLIVAGGAAGGKLLLCRYNDDGTLDTTFNAGSATPGKLLIDFGLIGSEQTTAYASSLAIDEYSRIYIAGDVFTANGAYDFAIARVNADGTLDDTFGALISGTTRTGFRTIDFGSSYHARANALAIDPDTGQITLAGFAGNRLALARVDDDGDVVSAFGTDGGHGTYELTGFSDIAYALKLDGESRIVVAGRAGGDMMVARFTDTGAFDSVFGDGHDGSIVFDIGTDDYAYDLAIDGEDRIVIVGEAGGCIALARLVPDGSELDDTFDEDGTLIDTRRAASYGWRVAVDPQGRIVTGGNTVLCRYLDDGTYDTTLGDNGLFEWETAIDQIDSVRALGMFSADGAITLVGRVYSENGADTNLAILRLLPDNRVKVIGTRPATLAIASDPNNPTTLDEGMEFTINLTASTGTNEDTIAAWLLDVNGRDVWVEGNPSSTVVTLPSGDYTLTATAIGSDGDAYEVEEGIAVSVANLAPTIVDHSMDATSAGEGDSVGLHAAATDPGPDEILEYTWNISKNSSPFATGYGEDYDLGFDDEGEYAIELVVDDGDGGSATQSMGAISVINVAPTVDAGEDQSVREGDTVDLFAFVSDPSRADTLSYAWDVQYEGASVATSNQQGFAFTPGDDGTYYVNLNVSDGTVTISDTMILTAANVAPRVLASVASYTRPPIEETVNLSVAAIDAADDNTTLQVIWGDGESDTFEASPGSSTTIWYPSHTYASAHDNYLSLNDRTITLTATDKDGANSTKVVNVNPSYHNNFQDGAAGGWSGSVSTAPLEDPPEQDAQKFLGLFGNGQTATLSMTGIKAHAIMHMEFDVYLVGDFDNFGASPLSAFTFQVDNTVVSPNSLPTLPPNCTPPAANLGYTWCGGVYYSDSQYHLSFDFLHGDSNLDFSIGASGLTSAPGAGSDQRWGIDNVKASIEGVSIEIGGVATDGQSDPDAYIPLNDDDSDDNGVKDCLQSSVSTSDPQLAQLRLKYPASPAGTKLVFTLSSGQQNLRIWETDGTPVLFDVNGEHDWSIPTTAGSKDLWIEGIEVNSSGSTQMGLTLAAPTWLPGVPPTAQANTRVETCSIRTDLNRDGAIELTGEADRSYWLRKEFRFWVNNDHDILVWDNKANKDRYLDEEVKAGWADHANGQIDNIRDLEDLARLQIKAPDALQQNANWSVTIEFTDVIGNPAINIYRAKTSGDEYLRDENEARKLVEATKLLTLKIDRAQPLALQLFDNVDKTAPLLFEVSSPGTAAIKVEFRILGKLVASSKLFVDFRPIADMYEHFTVGDVNGDPATTLVPPTATRVGTFSYDANSKETSDYLLFVHGWRLQPWERRYYAETAFNRLFWEGYQGRLGFFNWPTTYIDVDNVGLRADLVAKNFAGGIDMAFRSAPALNALLNQLNVDYPGKVRVIAHSMGALVTSEALRMNVRTNLPKIHTFIATQAATWAEAYDGTVFKKDLKVPGGQNWWRDWLPSVPYFAGLNTTANNLINFFNPNDCAMASMVKENVVILSRHLFPSYSWNEDMYAFYDDTTRLQPIADKARIFAYAMVAQSEPLGASAGVGGVFNRINEIDLNASFQYGASKFEHSPQFLSTNMAERQYWAQVIKSAGLPKSRG